MPCSDRPLPSRADIAHLAHRLVVRLGEVLQSTREAHTLTQVEVGQILGVQNTTISMIENGRSRSNIQRIMEYLVLLNVDMATAFPLPARSVVDQGILDLLSQVPDGYKQGIYLLLEKYVYDRESGVPSSLPDERRSENSSIA